jgi:hypothetical protein
MSFFRVPVIGKKSEIAFWLRISQVSQPKKNAFPQICRGNWVILEKLQDSANSKRLFHSIKKSKSLFPKNLTI